ncbi:ankyrin repeat domain-containing protein 50 [Coprinopsis cinerea okayama7|uniref:Ankyrin repeat domain-containing protein 50 n=1 Tax=Coprinopsis cinerea (strain Okayama-7 / 130 / ATCC MYA-4618 / FGSC 9003) TaxID=240176 RepID=A8NMM5_COPC7|nr:ankyrin repeat domain-containing protein 50 [Coprinopsis cinerea okayama7\|eukprot:XP_001834950.2 ankyrin repeat domain-containing protein 50 [Coprinopsis cinerea okayama7\
MGQFVSTPGAVGRHGGKIPGAYDFEKEDRRVFEHARHINIQGGVFNNNRYHVHINSHTSTVSPERRPGAGKTVLASTIIDDLLPLEEDYERTCVLFVYSRYTEPLSVTDIIKSLIKQCIERNHDLAGVVAPTYSKHKLEGTEPSVDELVRLLRTLESYFDRVYYVIDGVDEAHLDVRFDLIQVINKLKGNIMLTSRPLDDLGGDLSHAVFCTLTAQDSDIELHMEEKLGRFKQLGRVLDQNDCRKEILEQIIEKAEGMFLHAALQLESIQHCRTLQSVKTKLAEFPIGIQGVYAASLQRIQDQDPESRELAMQILFWLAFARGPLSMQDLRYALATDPETGAFSPERMPDEASVLSVCCGLVEHHTSNIVRLIHYTAKDALVPLLLEDYPQPHILITQVLIQRLVSGGLLQADLKELEELHDALEEQPLLQYAHEQIGAHIGECHSDSELTALVKDFLLRCNRFPVDVLDSLDLLDPPHVAAHYGLWPYFEFLADNGWNLNSKTKYLEQTPLHLAALSGDEMAVQHLLQLNIDPNIITKQGHSALFCATASGHQGVALQLLQIPGIEVNAASSPQGLTVLMLAAAQGHADIVSLLLLIPGIEVNAASSPEGMTALISAAVHGHVDVVSLLLQFPGIEVNAVNVHNGVTALMLAAMEGHADIVSLLLQFPGIEVNAADSPHGATALIAAVNKGHTDIVSLLLQFPGIEVNAASSRETEGVTALILAASKGHADIVSLLLQFPGIEVNTASSPHGITALMAAAVQGYVDVVSQLLQFPGIEVNAVTVDDGVTALMLAASEGSVDVVSLLLQFPGIEVNAVSSVEYGVTALMVAAMEGHADVISRLLHFPGIDVSSAGSTLGATALLWAAKNGHVDAVSRLLHHPGIDPHHRCNHHLTALALASRFGHYDVVRLLLECDGTDVNSADRDGNSPLILASDEGNQLVVELLLQSQGIDLDLKNNKGQTALSAAQEKGHEEIVAKLIEFQRKSGFGREPGAAADEAGVQTVEDSRASYLRF